MDIVKPVVLVESVRVPYQYGVVAGVLLGVADQQVDVRLHRGKGHVVKVVLHLFLFYVSLAFWDIRREVWVQGILGIWDGWKV